MQADTVRIGLRLCTGRYGTLKNPALLYRKGSDFYISQDIEMKSRQNAKFSTSEVLSCMTFDINCPHSEDPKGTNFVLTKSGIPLSCPFHPKIYLFIFKKKVGIGYTNWWHEQVSENFLVLVMDKHEESTEDLMLRNVQCRIGETKDPRPVRDTHINMVLKNLIDDLSRPMISFPYGEKSVEFSQDRLTPTFKRMCSSAIASKEPDHSPSKRHKAEETHSEEPIKFDSPEPRRVIHRSVSSLGPRKGDSHIRRAAMIGNGSPIKRNVVLDNLVTNNQFLRRECLPQKTKEFSRLDNNGVELGGVCLDLEDSKRRLSQDGELDDSLLDFFFKFLSTFIFSELQRNNTQVFSSLFYTRLDSVADKTPVDRWDVLKNWTKKITHATTNSKQTNRPLPPPPSTPPLLTKDVIIVPVNFQNKHWKLVAILYPYRAIQKKKDIGTEAGETIVEPYIDVKTPPPEILSLEGGGNVPSSDDTPSTSKEASNSQFQAVESGKYPLIFCIDSLGVRAHHSMCDLLLDFLQVEFEKKGDNTEYRFCREPGMWAWISRLPFPTQVNGHDCGVFVVENTRIIVQLKELLEKELCKRMEMNNVGQFRFQRNAAKEFHGFLSDHWPICQSLVGGSAFLICYY
eukprot:GHVP01062637.1.p1 GENE.GHVP01062637.1~~GHVP01062637.1.p1  ORF type:complete len:627 (+),score=97.98 GHVP01062637.1:19-1899(+)